MSRLYFDSCALVKLIVAEAESQALEVWLERNGGDQAIVTCDLAHTEVRRVLQRVGGVPEDVALAAELLAECSHIRLGSELLIKAGEIAPGTTLRSLDAIHVAAALELGQACRYFVTYDKRLAEAAAAQGLQVRSPGQ